jgi:hypothetical protein
MAGTDSCVNWSLIVPSYLNHLIYTMLFNIKEIHFAHNVCYEFRTNLRMNIVSLNRFILLVFVIVT